MDETPLPKVLVVGTLANAYAAYLSLAADMAHVRTVLESLTKEPDSAGRRDTDPMARALWWAAAVGYGRCFRSGRHKGYADKVTVPERSRELHRWLQDHRGEHVAHNSRTNDAEQIKAFVFLEPREGPRGVAAVGHQYMTMVMPGAEALDEMLTLVRYFETAFSDLATAAETRILAHAQARPLERIYQAAEGSEAMKVDEEYPRKE